MQAIGTKKWYQEKHTAEPFGSPAVGNHLHLCVRFDNKDARRHLLHAVLLRHRLGHLCMLRAVVRTVKVKFCDRHLLLHTVIVLLIEKARLVDRDCCR